MQSSVGLQEAQCVIESVIGDPNFEWLVLGCIEADFRTQILVGKHLTRSIILIVLCTAPLAKFLQIFVNFFFARFVKISEEEIRKCSSAQAPRAAVC